MWKWSPFLSVVFSLSFFSFCTWCTYFCLYKHSKHKKRSKQTNRTPRHSAAADCVCAVKSCWTALREFNPLISENTKSSDQTACAVQMELDNVSIPLSKKTAKTIASALTDFSRDEVGSWPIHLLESVGLRYPSLKKIMWWPIVKPIMLSLMIFLPVVFH